MAEHPDFEPAPPQAGPHPAPAEAQAPVPPSSGDGWYRGGAATQPAPGPSRLPWVLTALLAALSLVLGTLVVSQRTELNRLRAQVGATPGVVASGTPAANPSSTASSQPTVSQDPRAIAAMKKLPRRRAGDPAALGRVDAPVVIIVWSDYRCPFCSLWERQTMPQLQPYVDSGSLRIEHRDLVLFGEQSQLAAQAAHAAGRQGRFWQFYRAVHDAAPTSGHPDISRADLLDFARQADVKDLARFTADQDSAATRALVAADGAEARALGLSATPFFVINTTPLSGAQPTEVFTSTIEANGGHR